MLKFEIDGGLLKAQGKFPEKFVRTGADKVSVLRMDHKKVVKVRLRRGESS